MTPKLMGEDYLVIYGKLQDMAEHFGLEGKRPPSNTKERNTK